MMQKKGSIYFPNLDSLRFVAFLLVFLQHGLYNTFKAFEGKTYIQSRFINFFFLGGGTGVQFFFVLSGFLITYLIKNEIDKYGKLNLKFFYMRRGLRIWPLYFALVLFSFVIYPGLKSSIGVVSDLCANSIYYISFLANFDLIRIAHECSGKDAMIQSIVWSVSIEEQFYLVWPLLFFWIPRNRLILIPTSVLLLSIFFRLNHASDNATLYFHTLSVTGDLAIGGLLALIILERGFLYSWITNLSKRKVRFIYLLIFCTYFFNDLIQYSYANVFQRYLFDLCWGFVILEQNFNLNNRLKLGKVKWMDKWGKYTYGLYMLHPVGILIVDILFRILKIDNATFLLQLTKGCLALPISLVIAYVSFHYLEISFLKLKDKFTVVENKIYRAAA